MADALRDRISADIRAVAGEPAMTARLGPIGQAARGSTAAEFAADIEAQRAQMFSIAKMIGKPIGAKPLP
jgi:tripartite-type tricarboxylate transporter receptor subunit TctC